MAKRAIIEKASPLIAVSGEGQLPLDINTLRVLERAPLTYTHLTFKFGAEAYNEVTQQREPCVSERRRLFQYDEFRRYVCQKGFLPRIRKRLEDLGYEVVLIDHDPPTAMRPRPRCYDENWERVYDRFIFRPGQEDCLYQVAIHDFGVIDAVTAFGKMWIIAMICVLYPYAKIDIVTKRKEVVQSLVRMLTRWIPSVGQVGGGKRKVGRVTVYTADSIHKSDFQADIVLVDEVHEMMTDRYAELLARYWVARLYGFTASKETRADNAHHRMEGLAGPTIFYMDYPTAQRLGLVVPIIVQWLDVLMAYNPIQGYSHLVMRKKFGFWRNDYRNAILAGAFSSLAESGHQVLALVDTVDHAVHLRRHLPGWELCYSEAALQENSEESDRESRFETYVRDGLMSPDEQMTASRRENMRRAFEDRRLTKAIATGVWSVGVSFDSLQVLGRCGGGASETGNVQQPGRVCRVDAASGKECGIVIDTNDYFDSTTSEWSADRRRSYHRREWTQYSADGSLLAPVSRGTRGRL
jgi:hypothetical protein